MPETRRTGCHGGRGAPAYAHTQVGWMPLLAMFGALLALGASARHLGLGANRNGALMLTMGAFLLIIPLFGWLTVTVDGGALTARFGIGLFRKRIPLRAIRGAAPVRNKWYYGWGVRLGPWGWMYNVSGLDAVEIELQDGGRFRLGTDEPEELERAIRQRIEIKR
jgi:hypothetical protein